MEGKKEGGRREGMERKEASKQLTKCKLFL